MTRFAGRLDLDGWPPVGLIEVDGNNVLHTNARGAQEWEDFRLQCMQRWNHPVLGRCRLEIILRGAEYRKVQILERATSLIQALVGAGVLASSAIVQGYRVDARPGTKTRTEIRFYKL